MFIKVVSILLGLNCSGSQMDCKLNGSNPMDTCFCEKTLIASIPISIIYILFVSKENGGDVKEADFSGV